MSISFLPSEVNQLNLNFVNLFFQLEYPFQLTESTFVQDCVLREWGTCSVIE